ncbi:MAG TPA: acetate kinase, partial [Pyrinomonadaceae bacterium]|nr:acetate kinase [Pyrinomonadaceae bacterium]
MNVLVLNCGSSSLKFQLISTTLDLIEANADRTLAKGHIERIGGTATINFSVDGRPTVRSARPIRDIRAALDAVLKWIASDETQIEGVAGLNDIQAIGHRVVHGGERFSESVLIDDAVLQGIEECIELAPLHNPANIQGIQAARGVFGKA